MPPFSAGGLAFTPTEEPSGLGPPAEGEAAGADGALCCMPAPPAAPPSRPPMPCALARPVPAINAAVAAVIMKRLIIETSPHEFALPARQRKEIDDVPPFCQFRKVCLMNGR